jgi:hypothetical protein
MKTKEQKISIDGKTITLMVFKPGVFKAFIDVMIKNYDARQLIKEMLEMDKKEATTDINAAFPILGKLVKVRIAACESLDDLDLLYRSLKNMKYMHRIVSEFDDVIEITTNKN